MTLSANGDGLEATPCQVCGGLGNMGYPDHKTPCPECGGAGKRRDKKTGEILYLLPCNKCGGAGVEKGVAPMNLHERFARDWDTLGRTGLIVLARDLDDELTEAEQDRDGWHQHAAEAEAENVALRSKLERAERALALGDTLAEFILDHDIFTRGLRPQAEAYRSARSSTEGGKA